MSGATATGAGGRLPHLRSLDGVRAVAVVGVMLYHAGVHWVPGGFLGVDLFFVLSGFLITSLLLDERRRWGSVDLPAFWLRRARRLLPALFVVIGVVCVWTATLAPEQQPQAVRSDGLATLLYVANWRFVFSGQSYFDQYLTPSPFLHMWSLGIEEQWYLVFPLLLAGLLVLTAARARRTAAALALAAAGSALLMALLFVPGADPSRVYYGTDTRAQELLVGAALAVLLGGRPVPWARLGEHGTRRVAAAAGVLALGTLVAAFAWVADSDDSLFRGGFLIVSLVAAVLLASLVLAPEGPVAKVLGLRPVAAVGAVSYGLYLWHWPVDVLLNPDTTVLSGPGLLALRLGLTAGLATGSYWLVELPIRRGALRRLQPPSGAVLAATSFVLVGVIAVIFGTTPSNAGAATGRLPAPNSSTSSGPRTGVLLVGDSVAETLASGFRASEHPQVQLTTSTRLGCGLGSQQNVVDGVVGIKNHACDDWPDRWQRAVERDHPAVVVVLVGSWEVLDHRVGGKTLTVGGSAYAQYLTGLLDRTLQAVGGSGRRVVLLDVPCYQARATAFAGPDISGPRNDPRRAAAVNDVMSGFAATHQPEVTLLPFGAFLCPHGKYQDVLDGVQVRPDGVHPSLPGAALIWNWLVPRLGLPGTAESTSPKPSPSATGSPSPIRAYLVGDSVAYGLRMQLRPGSVSGIQVGGSTRLGCGLLPYDVLVDGRPHAMDPQCPAWSAAWRKSVRMHPVDVGVIFFGVGEQHDHVVNGSTVTFGTAADEQFLDAQLDAMVALFTDEGANVVLPTVPCHSVTQANIPGDVKIINDDGRIRWLDSVLRRYAAAHPQSVTLYDLYAKVCPHGYTDTLDGVHLRSDGLHFTAAGVSLVWSSLGPALLAAGNAAQTRRN